MVRVRRIHVHGKLFFLTIIYIIVVLAIAQYYRAVPTALRTFAPELNAASLSTVKCRFYIDNIIIVTTLCNLYQKPTKNIRNLSNPFTTQRVDGWERKQVGRGFGGDEAGDEWEESPEGGVRRKKSVKTKRKHRASHARAK